MTNNAEVWLCLSGGNALGAYHAGAYETLHQAGVRPTKIAGASVGAIVGALIAGNRPEDRIDRISAFWRIASDKFSLANAAPHWNTTKMASALGTLVHGRPGLFWPSMTQWWRRLAGLPSPSLFDRTELRSNLEKLIDFGRLNRGEIHLLINAVDVSSGDEVVFDNASSFITSDHLLASSAFPVLYSPERIDERLLVDGGLSANLPLRLLFLDQPKHSVSCLAFDLVSPRGGAPTSLDDALHRAQDLILANQSRRSIELLQQESRDFESSIALLHVSYSGEGEVGGKTLDYSTTSMKSRYDAGKMDGALAVDWLHEVGKSNVLPADRFEYHQIGRPAYAEDEQI